MEKAISKKAKKVTVVVPEMKLNLEDLAYLCSIQSNQLSCIPSNKSRNKMLFLGLVCDSEIKPTDAELRAFKERETKALKAFDVARKADDFDRLRSAARDLSYLREPQPSRGLVLTAAGRQLLSQGVVSTTLSEKGCA